jgi:outer membrane protein
LVVGAATIGLTVPSDISNAQAAGQAQQVGQGPTGVTQLPSTAPPRTQQAPVPKPLRALPRPDRPLLVSPSLQQLFGGSPPASVDIDQAVAIGLSTSRTLETAVEGLLQAQGRTSETRSAFNPTLGASFTYTRLNTGQTATFGNQSIDIVNADQPQLNATLALPLDFAGELRAATQQAQFQEIAARLDVNRARNQIVLDIKNAFYNVLRAQALVTVARETLQDDLDRLSDAQKKLTAGTVAPFDVLRAQTDVANAQQQLITANSNVSLMIADLNATLGVNIDAELHVTDRNAVENPPGVALPAAPTSAAPNAPAAPGNAQAQPAAPAVTPGATGDSSGGGFESLDLGPEYRAVVHEALRARPEILEADAQIAAARKGIFLARRSVFPTASVSLNGSYSPNAAGLAPVTTSGNLAFSVSIPILDGGTARARVTQARATAAEAETNRRAAVDQVNLDVRSAYLALLQARDRVAVANQALAQAQESYRLAGVRYNNGISTLVEVSDAQAALTQAENNQVNALYDYNNDRAILDRAAGRYAYVDLEPGYKVVPDPKKVSGNDARVRAAGGEK